MRKGNSIAAIIGILLSIYIISTALTFPESKNGVPGPGMFPLFIAGILLISSLVLLIKNIMDKTNTTSLEFNNNSKRVFIIIGALILYLILLPFLGIIIANTVLLSVLFIWFNKKQHLLYVGIAGIISSIVYLLFDKVLAVPLDFGLLFF